MSLGHQILVVLACGGLLSYAKKKPILDSPLQGRAHCAGSSGAPVYVTVLRCGPSVSSSSRQTSAACGDGLGYCFFSLSPAPGRCTRVEHEYFREGAWTYLAAWDVHRAKVFGRCEKTGIAPIDRLIGEVMSREPYQSARRVFWIMDNCSAHRGQRAVDRLRSQWPNVVLVHTPRPR